MMFRLGAALVVASLAFSGSVRADDATLIKLTLKDHKFAPAEVNAPLGKPLTIEIHNSDPTPAEFEAKTLRLEKAIAAGGTVTLQVRAPTLGRHRFFDDYHEDTTEGFLTVK